MHLDLEIPALFLNIVYFLFSLGGSLRYEEKCVALKQGLKKNSMVVFRGSCYFTFKLPNIGEHVK